MTAADLPQDDAPDDGGAPAGAARGGTAMSDDELVELLAAGELTLAGRMRWSSNATFLGELEGGGLVVYKPRKGERPLWDFATGTLCQREVAAFELSRLLGWGVVPPTVLRDGPHGEGSVQLFIDHDPEQHFLTLRDVHEDAFRLFAAFDVVANNADRKSGHCLLATTTHEVWGIDHGLTFHEEPKLRTVIWDYAGDPLTDEALDDLCRAAAQLIGREPAARALHDLLHPDELDALVDRIEELIDAARYPEPGGHHPYPWPIV
jgi:hypothetical protein